MKICDSKKLKWMEKELVQRIKMENVHMIEHIVVHEHQVMSLILRQIENQYENTGFVKV